MSFSLVIALSLSPSRFHVVVYFACGVFAVVVVAVVVVVVVAVAVAVVVVVVAAVCTLAKPNYNQRALPVHTLP